MRNTTRPTPQTNRRRNAHERAGCAEACSPKPSQAQHRIASTNEDVKRMRATSGITAQHMAGGAGVTTMREIDQQLINHVEVAARTGGAGPDRLGHQPPDRDQVGGRRGFRGPFLKPGRDSERREGAREGRHRRPRRDPDQTERGPQPPGTGAHINHPSQGRRGHSVDGHWPTFRNPEEGRQATGDLEATDSRRRPPSTMRTYPHREDSDRDVANHREEVAGLVGGGVGVGWIWVGLKQHNQRRCKHNTNTTRPHHHLLPQTPEERG